MLRDYQSDLINKLFRAYDDGYLAPCIVLLCGGGKSVITAEIAKHFTDGEKPVLFLVHRRELVEQIYYTFVGWGVDMSLCKIRMVQTAARRLPSMERPELIITDENHHSLAKTYQKIYDYFPDVRRVGVTATPERMGGKGLRDVNDILIEGVTAKWLIEKHHYSIKDVTVLQLYCAEQCAISDDSEMFKALNVNRDISLDMTDALLIQLKISDIFDFNNVYGTVLGEGL